MMKGTRTLCSHPDRGFKKRFALPIAIAGAFAGAYAGYHLPEHHPHDVVSPWVEAIGAAALGFAIALAVPFLLARVRR